MRFSARVYLTTLLLCVSCLGQYRSPADSTIEGNVYTNFFLRFRYTFSSSWVPQAANVAEHLPKSQQARLSDDDAGDETTRKAGKSYHLLTLFRTLPGQGIAGHSRAIISLVAEDVSSNSQITSGKDCVLKLADHMKKARYTAVGDPQEIQIKGHTFFRQDMKGTSAGAAVYQSGVCTLTGGYAVGFLMISPSQSLLTHMVGTASTVQFY